MLIIRAGIFRKYSELIFGFSTKIGLRRSVPYHFNMSLSVNDSSAVVESNRKLFFRKLGLNGSCVVSQRQVHGDNVKFINDENYCGESDAMITHKSNLGLAISSADCPAIFLYDPINRIIAAVHSGWRGTQKKILLKTLSMLVKDFNSKPMDITAYVAPSIHQKNYEVGEEVASLFEEKYKIHKGEKFLLSLQSINKDLMLDSGLQKKNIQVSSLCSYGMKDLLHSYRRDGEKSGRAFGVIAMKNQS
jgi:YfiH family protein